jgi:RNA polymerase sigma factor (sigma-70 family)
MDVADVIERVRADPGVRDVLVDELYGHGPILLAAARVITLDNDEAEDLVQTTFEIALRRMDGLREPLALRAWLLTIQSREAFRVVRRLRRIVRLDGRTEEIPSQGADLAQRADIRQALSGLPRRTRAAIALHYLAGLTVPETALALGVSQNTIKTQLKAGLGRLREELRDGRPAL